MKKRDFWGNLWGNLKPILRRLEFLGLYSYLKVQSIIGRRSGTFDDNDNNKLHLSRIRILRLSAYLSSMILFFLTIATIIPIYTKSNQAEATTGTATASTLTFTSTSSTASVTLAVNSADGTFATSGDNQTAAFSIATNNYTGYTLKVKSKAATDLSNNSGNNITSIDSAVAESTFTANTEVGKALNNKWGYLPSYYNSAANTNTYYPATTTEATIRTTEAANTTADNYTIGLGLRADYANPSGNYGNSDVLVLEYIANAVGYTIVFSDDTGDNTVANLPATLAGFSDEDNVVLVNNTFPTRDGYYFARKWCLGNTTDNGLTCNGTEFAIGSNFGIDRTTINSTTLYAVWSDQPVCNTNAANIADALCMQDFNNTESVTVNGVTTTYRDAIIDSMVIGVQYQLLDNRDMKQYYIARQLDGNVWMTQNLDLCIGCEGTATLTSLNTDINYYGSGSYVNGYAEENGIITWTPETITSNYTISDSVVSPTPSSKDQSVEGGDIYVYTSGTESDDIVYTSRSECEIDHNDNSCQHYHVGNYYGNAAAIASSELKAATIDDVANSICPAGWDLPHGSINNSAAYEDRILLRKSHITTAYDGSSSNGIYASNGFIDLRSSPLYINRAGELYYTMSDETHKLSDLGAKSYFMSGTIALVPAIIEYRSSGMFYNQLSSRMLGTIRCLARREPNFGVTTISFDKNSNAATGTMANQTIASEDSMVALPKNGYFLLGYVLDSWNTVADGTGATVENETAFWGLAGGGAVTLYAQWVPGHTITYNANGGSGDSYMQGIATGESGYILGNDFTRANYYFKGWGLSPNTDVVTYRAGQSISPTSDMTLYAVWGSSTSSSLYDIVASLNYGRALTNTDTNGDLGSGPTASAGIQAEITEDNSGVFSYNTNTFGNSSDANNNYSIYIYRGILDSNLSENLLIRGSSGDSANYPNYVKLAGTCWRIVRTTGSGGVKMIYNGKWTGSTCANATTNAQTTTSPFNTDSSTVGGKSYTGLQYQNMHAIGYTYSTVAAGTTTNTALSTLLGSSGNNTTTNSKSSIIKQYIEDWYDSNLSSYTSILEPSAGYCNDRTVYPNGSYALSNKLAENTQVKPYGTSDMTIYYFGAYTRNMSAAQAPTLNCPRGIVDLYSTTTASGGNGQLGKPVALLTADEASFAGSGSSTASQGSSYHANSFLRSGSNFWLLSPNYRYSGGSVSGFYLFSGGYLGNYNVGSAYGVRPAISLTSGTTASSGSGTATDPWVVNGLQTNITVQFDSNITSVEIDGNIITQSGTTLTLAQSAQYDMRINYADGYMLNDISVTSGDATISGTTLVTGSNDSTISITGVQKAMTTFNIDSGIASIVVGDNTISQSDTTISLMPNTEYSMQITLNNGYVLDSISVSSGDATLSGKTLTVGSADSVITITSQASTNVNVSFTFSNVTSVEVDGQTITTSGDSVSLASGSTYSIKVTPASNYKLGSTGASITSGTWYEVSNVNTDKNTFDLTVGKDNGVITIATQSCITADTLITLADGNKKRVADLTGDEELLVWDFDTASYGTAPIVFIEPEPEAYYDIIHLFFEDETDVEISYEHGFFDYTLGEFIYINNDNPEQYIGHQFIMQDGDSYKTVELTDIKYETKYTALYGLTTYKHFNFFNNDMLSIEGNITGMFNYFDVDLATMGYDQAKKRADIEKYGLLTYEDFGGMIDELGFEAYNGQYLNVSIGKGLTTWDDIKALADYYGHFTEDALRQSSSESEQKTHPSLPASPLKDLDFAGTSLFTK